MRRLILLGDSAQAVLERSERVTPRLDQAATDGIIGSYDSPSRYLPSVAGQKARQRILPDEATLRSGLHTARDGLPFAADTFERFIQDIATTKTRQPAGRQQAGRTPGLPAPALRWLAGGLLAVILLLMICLKFRRAARVVLSLGISLLLTVAILALLGTSLTPFQIAALLLVAGIGLDYALFVSHERAGDHDQWQVAKSLLICAATTILAFFFMIFSTAPILMGIGLTVSIGVTLSLLSAMVVCPAPRSA